MTETVPCGPMVGQRACECACGAVMGTVATSAAGDVYVSWKIRHVTMNPLPERIVELRGRCPGCNCLLVIPDLAVYLKELVDNAGKRVV